MITLNLNISINKYINTVVVLVAQLCLIFCNPLHCSLPGSSIHAMSKARKLEWVAISFSRDSSQPRDRTQVSHFADRLPSEPLGNSKTTAVGSLSLLQGIFVTQGFNQGLLHCRQILYQLSYQEGP